MAWLQTDLPFDVFEEELLAPIKGVELTEIETFVAGLLLRATSEVPIKQAAIIVTAQTQLNAALSERQVRKIVRGLRRDHGFPICTRKGDPAGYWWGRTEAELEEFVRVWQAQYLDEAQTLSMMLKTNYPRLAGQLRLALED